MANEVPADDLPAELVPEDDMPSTGKDYVGRRTGASPQKIERFVKPVEELRKGQGVNWDMAGKRARGLAETVGRGVAGMVATPVAGLMGMAQGAYNLATGSDKTPAGERVRRVTDAAVNAMPMSSAGQEVGGALAETLKPVGDFITEQSGKTGEMIAHAAFGPQAKEGGRAIGEVMPEVAATVWPAGKALQGAKAAGAAATTATKEGLSQVQNALLAIKKDGYKVPPSAVNPTAVNKVATTVAHPETLMHEVRLANAANDTRLAKLDLGIPPETPLNAATLEKLKGDANTHYTAIKQLTDLNLTPDDQLRAAVQGADKASQEVKAMYPDYYRNSKLERVREEVLNPQGVPTPGGVLEHISNLRKDANTLYKKASPSPKDLKAAAAMRNVATALEDFLERRMTEEYFSGTMAAPRTAAGTAVGPLKPPQAALPGPAGVGPTTTKYGTLHRVDNAWRQKLVDDWRKARTQLAKIHDLEGALNPQLGKVDTAKLSRMQRDGAPLSGNLKKIADAHDTLEGLSTPAIRASDSSMGGAVVKAAKALTAPAMGAGAGFAAGGAPGAAAGAAIGLAVPASTRAAMVGKLYQQYMTNPSPGLLQQIRKLDPKAAAALAASSAGKNNTPLPPPAQALPLEPEQ